MCMIQESDAGMVDCWRGPVDTSVQFDDNVMGMICTKLNQQVMLYNSDNMLQRLSCTVSGYAGENHYFELYFMFYVEFSM